MLFEPLWRVLGEKVSFLIHYQGIQGIPWVPSIFVCTSGGSVGGRKKKQSEEWMWATHRSVHVSRDSTQAWPALRSPSPREDDVRLGINFADQSGER